jgi:hypothetical protein
MITDEDCYRNYPQYRHWFNKLWLAEALGYECGPCGVAPKRSDCYIVRPIVNLSGMGIGAEKKYIEAGDYSQCPPGYFWCQWFEGIQYSVTFTCDSSQWKQVSYWRAERNIDQLFRFKSWHRQEGIQFLLPSLFDQLKDVPTINVEYIGDRIIEVHLRDSPDPDADELIPVWKDTPKQLIDNYRKIGYSYLNSPDDGDGFLRVARLGFLVKEK